LYRYFDHRHRFTTQIFRATNDDAIDMICGKEVVVRYNNLFVFDGTSKGHILKQKQSQAKQ
jgi:hypothetical protein